ncbi:MAG: hypothetical protein WKG01_33550 [Kofleriaceae bacterium]
MYRWIAVVALGLAPATARAGQATCSNPGLPVGAAASSELMPGRLTVNLTSGLLPIASEEVLAEATGPVLYDTTLLLVETRLAAEYAMSPWLAFTVAAPYRVVDVAVTHRDPSSGNPLPPPTTIHARTETIHGLGDLSLGAHVVRDLGSARCRQRASTIVVRLDAPPAVALQPPACAFCRASTMSGSCCDRDRESDRGPELRAQVPHCPRVGQTRHRCQASKATPRPTSTRLRPVTRSSCPEFGQDARFAH